MKKILIIQNKRIGDVLISSVIANNIKKIFPESHIDFMAYDFTTGVIENNPNIDNIIPINEKELKKIPNLIKMIRKVRKEKYDIIFDPYSKLQSRLICYFSKAKYRIGNKRKHKKLPLRFYSHPINLLDEKTQVCGKAIEDRINLITSVFPLENPDFEPKITLKEEEKIYPKLDTYKHPVLMLGILGSTPQKSMPYEYIAEIVDYLAANYKVHILFNYAPHQKEEAQKIYTLCKHKESIILDIYEDSIRGFVRLMYACDIMVANEGGIVHIAKALNKPTFTIFSPYVNKDHWASFEDGKQHESIHLLEEKPDLFNTFTFEERKKIEENPHDLYKKLTPEMIIPKLEKFLALHLKNTHESDR
jgi:heptosyltransferase-2